MGWLGEEQRAGTPDTIRHASYCVDRRFGGGRLMGGQLRVMAAFVQRRDLSPAAKWLLVSIADRLGDNGHCWPSVRTMAKDIGVSVGTVLRASDQLETIGLLEIERRGNGRGHHYRVTVSGMEALSGQAATVPTSGALPNRERSRNGNSTVPRMETEALPGWERNLLNEPTPRTCTGARSKPARPKWATKDLEGIYLAYPRHVSKASALKAIGKALDRIAGRPDAPADPVAWLLDRVQAFAESPAGQAGRFTPHPATWFNSGRYDDDSSEWNRREDFKSDHDDERAAAAGNGQREGRSLTGQRRASPRGRADRGEYPESGWNLPRL